MWPLRTILYFTVFWGACVVSLANPIWGVVNYMMVYQIHPRNVRNIWWGIPMTRLGMRFSLLAAVFIALGLVFGRKHIPRIRPALTAWEVGLCALVAIAAITLALGFGYNDSSLHAFEKLWKMLVFVLILGRLATTRRNLKIVIWTLVAGSFYVGYDAFTAPVSSFWLGRLELIGGPDFSTTSGTAAHLVAMLPIIGVAFLTTNRWRWRLFALISGGFVVNTIIMCRTRSAFIGLACGTLVALLAAPRARRYRIHGLLVCGAVVAFALTDSHFWDRMGTLTDRQALAQDAATVNRAEIWKLSLEMLAGHPYGVGPGNFARVIGTYNWTYHMRSSHNTLIACFTELGVQGGVLFLLMVLGCLRYLWSSAKLAARTDDPLETRLFAYAFLVSFITYFVTGLGTERFYCESFWWVLVLPLCLFRLVTGEVAAHAESRQEASAQAAPEPLLCFGRVEHGM